MPDKKKKSHRKEKKDREHNVKKTKPESKESSFGDDFRSIRNRPATGYKEARKSADGFKRKVGKDKRSSADQGMLGDLNKNKCEKEESAKTLKTIRQMSVKNNEEKISLREEESESEEESDFSEDEPDDKSDDDEVDEVEEKEEDNHQQEDLSEDEVLNLDDQLSDTDEEDEDNGDKDEGDNKDGDDNEKSKMEEEDVCYEKIEETFNMDAVSRFSEDDTESVKSFEGNNQVVAVDSKDKKSLIEMMSDTDDDELFIERNVEPDHTFPRKSSIDFVVGSLMLGAPATDRPYVRDSSDDNAKDIDSDIDDILNSSGDLIKRKPKPAKQSVTKPKPAKQSVMKPTNGSDVDLDDLLDELDF